MPSQCVTGVIAQSYHQSEKSASEFDAIVAQTEQFLADNGRRPRILIAKMGQDGHDRGAKVIASAYSDLGFDVDLSPMFSTPEEIARLAVENDVHVVGASSLAAGHKTLIPELVEALKKWGREDICVVAGGVIPPQDYAFLQERGVAFDERDIKQDNPTEQELRAWHEKSGLPLKRFFNTSGLQYKALGLKDKLPAMTEDEQYALLATDGMLVKRPLLIGEDFALPGFKVKEWEERL